MFRTAKPRQKHTFTFRWKTYKLFGFLAIPMLAPLLNLGDLEASEEATSVDDPTETDLPASMDEDDPTDETIMADLRDLPLHPSEY